MAAPKSHQKEESEPMFKDAKAFSVFQLTTCKKRVLEEEA